MPIEPTPRAQAGAEPVAIYCTGEVTVAPGAGLVTVTVAHAGAANAIRIRGIERKDFITQPLENGSWQTVQCHDPAKDRP